MEGQSYLMISLDLCRQTGKRKVHQGHGKCFAHLTREGWRETGLSRVGKEALPCWHHQWDSMKGYFFLIITFQGERIKGRFMEQHLTNPERIKGF